jgi:putative transposase
MAYTQLIYQIIFSTKNREKVMYLEKRDILYKYISGILSNKNCHLYCINGVEDHLHILTHVHPGIAIASLVKDIKVASSIWIKTNNVFKGFNGWQSKYGAFSYSVKEKENLIKYVENQVEHHKKISFEDEFIQILQEFHVEYNEKYLF